MLLLPDMGPALLCLAGSLMILAGAVSWVSFASVVPSRWPTARLFPFSPACLTLFVAGLHS
jgi:hypothetical protein